MGTHSMRSLLTIGAMAIAVASAPPAASAQGRSADLVQRGSRLLDDLRFEEALEVLSAALLRSGEDPARRARVYELLGYAYLALGREAEAEAAYRALLALRPDYRPTEDLSPRFRRFVEEVRTRWETEGRPGRMLAPVSLHHRSPPRAERGEPLTLEVALKDPSGRVARVVLAWRPGDALDETFRRLEATHSEGRFTVTVPADVVRPPFVEYYFEALDAQGLPVAARGDAAAPLRVTVPGPSQGGLLSKWWFWAAVGAVAVGGAATAFLLLDSPTPTGSLVVVVE